MAIVRWRPYGEVATLQDEMNRLFESFFGRGSSTEAEPTGMMWGPRADIHETKDSFEVDVELPGLSREDVKLTVHESTLAIEGEKKVSHEEAKGTGWHRQERVFGKFQRVFSMPAAVEAARISATFKNGVLSITLPKKETARPKEIAISVK